MPRTVLFEDFRRWAIDQSRAAAWRWEDPNDDEIKVLLGADDYGAFHVIPLPPIYLQRDRGYVYWLAAALPDVVASRSLQQVAFRASAWTSSDRRYADRPADDPNRSELLFLNIAEKGRYEAWHAPIKRSGSGLPCIGEWLLYATQDDDPVGNLPDHIRAALGRRGASRGPTMPAANMVLGPWDVPNEFFPVSAESGPLDVVRERTSSSYFAIFRPELPGPVIVSQTLVYQQPDAPRGHVEGAVESLLKAENTEFTGPPLGDESHYFEGKLGHLYRYTALWRYPFVLCEIAIAGPPGRYTSKDVYRYAAIQDKRATAELDRRPMAS